MNRKASTIILTFIICCVYTINAQIVTDRPDQTESSSTVPRGALQLESGYLIGLEGEPLSTKQVLLPTTLFRYGINDWIELRALNQFETVEFNGQKTRGISDFEIGAKVQLLKKEEVNTEIAFLTHLIVPTGSEELSNGDYGSISKLSISHGLSETVGLGYNIGYDNFGFGSGDLTYSIALGIGVSEKVGVYIEPFGAIENFEDHVSSFDAGFTYLPDPNLQLDF